MARDDPRVTDALITALAALGVVGQVVAALLLLVGMAALFGAGGAARRVRELLWGYELWLAFAVAAVATGGSLIFSEVAHFIPCELCWYQRIAMYPLSITLLLAALANDHRVARYLLPFPILGSGVAIYHLLVENRVIEQTQACQISAPGGCATRWIEEFRYLTIPTLSLTAFVLLFAFLILATLERPAEADMVGDDGDEALD
jgi:disulfide bond formation protein DsbB